MQQIHWFRFSVGQAIEWNFVCLRSGRATLPGPPQLCYVSLLFPAVKSLMSDALKKLPLEPSTADHLLSNMDHCLYSYTLDVSLNWDTWNDSPFLATLTSLEVSVTPLKLLEGRDGQKTGSKLVLCGSRLLEKVVVRDTVTANLSAWYSVLACFPLGLMCVYVCIYMYVYTHICIQTGFSYSLRKKAVLFFSPSKCSRCLFAA